MNPDVVVISAGIGGTSCAYYLAQSGLKVHLVEKGPIGSGASRAGMSHMVTWEEPEIHLELARQSNLLYEELRQTLPTHIEYRHTGIRAVLPLLKLLIRWTACKRLWSGCKLGAFDAGSFHHKIY
jgi:sarcosine oxidase subunit beta